MSDNEQDCFGTDLHDPNDKVCQGCGVFESCAETVRKVKGTLACVGEPTPGRPPGERTCPPPDVTVSAPPLAPSSSVPASTTGSESQRHDSDQDDEGASMFRAGSKAKTVADFLLTGFRGTKDQLMHKTTMAHKSKNSSRGIVNWTMKELRDRGYRIYIDPDNGELLVMNPDGTLVG